MRDDDDDLEDSTEFEVGRGVRRRGGFARMMRGLAMLFAFGILVLAAGAYFLKVRFDAEGPLTEARIVEVQSGSSLSAIASKFEADGVISSALLFRASARLLGVAGSVKAGDYEIPVGASMREVLRMVTSGQAIDYRITVAEGLTVYAVVELVKQNEVLVGEIERIPSEGMIAPETYFVRRGETRQAVIDRMVAAQEKILAELWAARATQYKGKPLPLASPEEALILASIVEKETGVASERGMVASVFVNRLIKGMRLQTDPTVIYGLTMGKAPLGRGLRRSELDRETPFNTYVISGLPPTPIANPGLAALRATLQPTETDYFYFVADGSGGHAFAKTLQEHNANVKRWRKIERERKANQ